MGYKLFLEIYIGDLEEAAIKDLLKGIEVKVIYDVEVSGSKEEIIDFSKCDSITIENAIIKGK